MSKMNIRIHECGSSASSLGPSPMGVLRMQPTKKKSEASDGLDAEWDDLAAVLKGLFLRNADEPSGKYFYVKSDYRNDDDILHSVYNKGQDTLLLEIHLVGTEPNMVVVNPGNYTDETFDMAYGVVEPIAQEMFLSLDSNGYHGTISKIDDASEYGAWKKQHGYEDTSAIKKNESNEDAQAVLQANYGDGDTYYGESSANGFYATERHPMAWAILNNDVAALESLHNGTATTPDKPWNCHGWSEDIDAPEDSEGNYPYVYNMDTDYEETFVEDMPDRVVGETDNQNALRKALEYYPDFVLPFVDFWNAFHKGYDKDLLLSFLYNARNLYNDMQVDIQEYLDYDEFGKDAYNNLESFLEGK